jgi:hypothetical protein
MTSAQTVLTPTAVRAVQVHASDAEYRSWVNEHIPHPAARWQRMVIYRRFLGSFPDLSTWFDAPLSRRLGFTGGPRWAKGRTKTHEAIGYLAYLSLVKGISLDYEYLLARQFTRLFSVASGGGGLGVDTTMLQAWVERMVQLGYAEPTARADLTWSLTRLVLQRGDPNLDAITGDDVFALAAAVRSFGSRDDFALLRAAMHPRVPVADGAAERYVNNHLNKVHATHVLLYNLGQVSEPPTWGTVAQTLDWSDRLLPEPCPPAIRAVVERYLRLRLDAKSDRPQTVRLARESLRRFINWLCVEHPDIDNLSGIGRAIAEEYLDGCRPISARTPGSRWRSRQSNTRSTRLPRSAGTPPCGAGRMCRASRCSPCVTRRAARNPSPATYPHTSSTPWWPRSPPLRIPIRRRRCCWSGGRVHGETRSGA